MSDESTGYEYTSFPSLADVIIKKFRERDPIANADLSDDEIIKKYCKE